MARRRSIPSSVVLPNSEDAADLRPVTRSRAAAVRGPTAGTENLAFLAAEEFDAAEHVPAMYRLDARLGPTVRDKGAQGSPGETGLPSVFSAVDLNDRRGVWQSEPSLVKALGEDPSKQQRVREGQLCTPAGLKNLGATCYLNSLLQYLFFNVDFRESLLHLNCDSAVVGALQQVFALLALGERRSVDPSQFVSAASIDALEQADATEFSALLLDWLQREISRGQECSSSNFVSDCFEGEVSQVLSCLENPTHVFERREHFYELRARLTPAVANSRVAAVPEAGGKEAVRAAKKPKGRAKPAPLPAVGLEHLLQETAFPEELLSGANRYHCPQCDRKVNAKKCTRLARLPPYLHVTVERYHYDLAKGIRRKLDRSVSFPRRLELRLRAPPVSSSTEALHSKPVETAIPVVYECVGYLEHVSDSAHSGHYTATLLQEESPRAPEGLLEGTVSGEDSSGASQKRRRCDSADADAAAGVPRERFWWSLDDETVTAVNWPGVDGGDRESSESSRAPDRIESGTAYLVLYRRTDHVPGNLLPLRAGRLPAHLASFVAEANTAFALEREKHAAHLGLVQTFLAVRRRAVSSFVQALRERDTDAAAGDNTLCFVPSSWLSDFLRAEDRQLDDLAGEDDSLAPVLYGQSLLRRPGCAKSEFIDPLAVWCGEVKLVPKSALDALGGTGGLDGSLFLPAAEALSPEACRTLWQLFRVWCQEQEDIALLLRDGKLSAAEARQLEAQGRDSEAVWVSQRVHNTWRRASRSAESRTSSRQREDWLSFLAEAHRARWGRSSSSTAPPSTCTDTGSRTSTNTGLADQARAGQANECLEAIDEAHTDPSQSLLAGLTCVHGLVHRPRAGLLFQRGAVVRLLKTSGAKERLYKELWPGAYCVPSFSSGPTRELLSLLDVCTQCHSDAGPQPSGKDTAGVLARTFTVRRRFSSGSHRKLGTVSVTVLAEDFVVTCRELKAVCQEKFGWAVARLITPRADGQEIELQGEQTVDESVSIITVEKDESATPAEREGAAFESSVFRTVSAST